MEKTVYVSQGPTTSPNYSYKMYFELDKENLHLDTDSGILTFKCFLSDFFGLQFPILCH